MNEASLTSEQKAQRRQKKRRTFRAALWLIPFGVCVAKTRAMTLGETRTKTAGTKRTFNNDRLKPKPVSLVRAHETTFNLYNLVRKIFRVLADLSLRKKCGYSWAPKDLFIRIFVKLLSLVNRRDWHSKFHSIFDTRGTKCYSSGKRRIRLIQTTKKKQGRGKRWWRKIGRASLTEGSWGRAW